MTARQNKSLLVGIILACALAIVVLSVFAVLTTHSAAVQAQTQPSQASASTSSANQLPQIYVDNLSVGNASYSAGSTVSGSFVISNKGSTFAPSIYYRVELAGNYQSNGLPTTRYDQQVLGSISLNPGQAETIPFTYTLPANVSGTGFGIRIQALTQTGLYLGWQDDEPITITAASSQSSGASGSGVPVASPASSAAGYANILSDSVQVATSTFGPDVGPTVYTGQSVTYSVVVQNPGTTPLTLVPHINIYNHTDTNGAPLSSYVASTTILAAGQTKTLTYSLPTFNYQPLVYAGTIDFTDSTNSTGNKGNETAPLRTFRYIVNGAIATIQSITAPVSSLSAGQQFSATLYYTGTPFDVQTGQTFNGGSAMATVAVYNQNNQEIASANQTISLNGAITPVSIPLSASAAAQSATVQAQIVQNGRTLSTYSAPLFTGTSAGGGNSGGILKATGGVGVLLFIVALILLLTLIIVLVALFHGREIPLVIVGLIIFLTLVIVALLVGYYYAYAATVVETGVCDSYGGDAATQGASPSGSVFDQYAGPSYFWSLSSSDFAKVDPNEPSTLDVPSFIKTAIIPPAGVNNNVTAKSPCVPAWGTNYTGTTVGLGHNSINLDEEIFLNTPSDTNNSFTPGDTITVAGNIDFADCTNAPDPNQEVSVQIAGVGQTTYVTGNSVTYKNITHGDKSKDYSYQFSFTTTAPTPDTLPTSYSLNVWGFNIYSVGPYVYTGPLSGNQLLAGYEVVTEPITVASLPPIVTINPANTSAAYDSNSPTYLLWSVAHHGGTSGNGTTCIATTTTIGGGASSDTVWGNPANQNSPGYQTQNGVWSGNYGTAGLLAPTSFTLTCTNSGGSSSATANVYITPTVTVTAGDPSSVIAAPLNSTVPVQWLVTIGGVPVSATNSGLTCAAAPSSASYWSPGTITLPSGTSSTSPLNSWQVYTPTLNCTNAGGGSSGGSATIHITPQISLNAVTPVQSGTASSVNWSVQNDGSGLTCSYSNGDSGWSSKTPVSTTAQPYTGNYSTAPITTTTTYTLTCGINGVTGSTASSSASTVVTTGGGGGQAPGVNFNINPSTETCPAAGQAAPAATLSWSSTNATLGCVGTSIDPTWNNDSVWGATTTSISGTALTSQFSQNTSEAYVLVCQNSNGITRATSTLTVSGCVGSTTTQINPVNGFFNNFFDIFREF